jgi:tetratricopeptide (TPR) repeat protein
MRRFCRTCTLSAALFAAAWTVAAVAAEPSPEELYRRGVIAYRAGRYEEAVTLIGRADALEPHAELAYDLARAYEGAHDPRHALDTYREYLRLSPDAEDAQAVRARIDEIQRGLDATATDVVIATHPDGATLVVDGKVLGSTPWKGTLAAGAHHLVLNHVGSDEVARDVVVVSGQKLVVHLDMERREPTSAVAAGTSHPGQDRLLERVRLPTWITAGVGVVALGTAAGFQVAEQVAEDGARAAKTQLAHQENYHDAARDRDVARVLVGVGAAAVVAGAVLFTLDLTRRKEHTRTSRTGVSVGFGVLGGNVEGRF